MGGNYFSNAGVFLIQTIIGLYTLVVMLRFLLQMVRADFHNPITQILVKLTNPPLKPLRRIIPGLGGIDVASLVLLLALQTFELVLIGLLPMFSMPNPVGVLVLASAQLLSLLVSVYLFSVIIMVVISWISPGNPNPVVTLLYQLTAPLMNPARRHIPPLSGLDLSPMAVIIVLYLVILLVVQPLLDFGRGLAY